MSQPRRLRRLARRLQEFADDGDVIEQAFFGYAGDPRSIVWSSGLAAASAPLLVLAFVLKSEVVFGLACGAAFTGGLWGWYALFQSKRRCIGVGSVRVVVTTAFRGATTTPYPSKLVFEGDLHGITRVTPDDNAVRIGTETIRFIRGGPEAAEALTRSG